MFAKIGKVLFVGCMFAAILLTACERGEQANPDPTQAAVIKAQEEATKAAQEKALEAAQAQEEVDKEAEPTITAEEAQAQEAAKAQAIVARKKAQEAAKDPCRKLVCSTDDEPWRGCYYAAALYRDAPGTVAGVRHVVSILKPDQVMWYRDALLASYRRDLWFSTDYRMGDATDLNQAARDVRVGIFGDKDTDAMSEAVVCGLLGSTDITLADLIAASRANSPFVGTKKVQKEGSLYLRDPFATDAPPPAAPPTEPDCGADPCPPPSDTPAIPDPGPSGDQAAPVTSPPTDPVPAEPPAGETPAAPAFDPAAVPPATDPVPVAPPATDPADPAEPVDAAPPAKSGDGTVAYYSGHGF